RFCDKKQLGAGTVPARAGTVPARRPLLVRAAPRLQHRRQAAGGRRPGRRGLADAAPSLDARASPAPTPDAEGVPVRSTRRRPARCALPLVSALLAACTTMVNPVTGQREVTLMSPQQEVAAGREAAAQVAEQIGLVEDPALQRYVEAIGQRLAAASPRRDVQYRFAIADMPEPNAFALPGGWIYVSRGLLAYANSEDELANVMGHEIGHVAARHAAQRQTRATGVGLLSALGTLAAA